MKFLLLFLVFISKMPDSKADAGLEILNFFLQSLSHAGNQPRDEDSVLKKGLSVEQINFTAKEDEIKNCTLLKQIKTKRRIEVWDIPNACELLLDDLKKEAAIQKGDTLYIHPADFDCSLTYLKGHAYKCVHN